MPSRPLSLILTGAAALALALAVAMPGPAAAQDMGYYGMRNQGGMGFSVPSGRTWSAYQSNGGAARAGLPGQGRGMTQAMRQQQVPGLAQTGTHGPGQGQRQGQGQFQPVNPVQLPATAGSSRTPGFQPLPGSPGTRSAGMTGTGMASGFTGTMTATPQMMPSPYGAQLQQPKRANLRVDNRAAQPGGG